MILQEHREEHAKERLQGNSEFNYPGEDSMALRRKSQMDSQEYFKERVISSVQWEEMPIKVSDWFFKM